MSDHKPGPDVHPNTPAYLSQYLMDVEMNLRGQRFGGHNTDSHVALTLVLHPRSTLQTDRSVEMRTAQFLLKLIERIPVCYGEIHVIERTENLPKNALQEVIGPV